MADEEKRECWDCGKDHDLMPNAYCWQCQGEEFEWRKEKVRKEAFEEVIAVLEEFDTNTGSTNGCLPTIKELMNKKSENV